MNNRNELVSVQYAVITTLLMFIFGLWVGFMSGLGFGETKLQKKAIQLNHAYWQLNTNHLPTVDATFTWITNK